MIIAKASMSDLDEIMSIFKDGQAFLKEKGIDQWQDGYPTIDIVKEDITNRRMHVVLDNDGICAVYVLVGKDPTYKYIEDGSWMSDTDYVTIHRICVKGNKRNKGIAKYIVDDIKKYQKHIRIDTHKDNRVMQHFLRSNGFLYRGIIYLDNGKARNAFEYLEV